MEKKFTPGPWAYYECMSHGLAGGDTTLAVGSDLEVRDHICFLRVGGIGLPQDQVEANARLIAASPKLLKALIDLKATLDPYDYQYGNQVHIIDTAIIEAVGVQEPKAEAVNPTGCMLDMDGYVCSYEEFLRENKELDMMDREKVGDLKRGESVYLGIQEVKRIQ
jgi:hypothetical protein